MSFQSHDPEQWMLYAACIGRTDLFFAPDDSESRGERRNRESQAKRVCVECIVRGECLDEAMHSDERFGIWGGMTERERRAARRGSISRVSIDSPEDIAGSGLPRRLPAVAVRGRPMSYDRVD